MSRPQTYRTEALVLHQRRTGEADRILTLYTPGLGKTRAVASEASEVVLMTSLRVRGWASLGTSSFMAFAFP